MKTRNGFVSNSSSSSFVIGKHYLSPHQIEQIKDYKETSEKLEAAGFATFDYVDDYWQIRETEDYIKGDTLIDNFDMQLFLTTIGVQPHRIDWD